MPDKKKTIGLILEEISIDYSAEIIHSIMKALSDRVDIRLIVMAGKQGIEGEVLGNQQKYNNVYNNVYKLKDRFDLDGMILTLPNLAGKEIDNPDLLEVSPDIPKVFIASAVPGEVSVTYDNESGIREAVDYLVRVKGFTRMCMLGGREDNSDSIKRKEIFTRCLADRGIDFLDRQYEATDMSVNTFKQSRNLLNRNPDCEAVFCVNDQVATGLYEAMKERGLLPGKDIMVFGFDNTVISGNMVPPLASIGSDSKSQGQVAVELLISMMEGEKAESVVLPTRLYGKESLDYAKYVYSSREVLAGGEAVVDKMFDDCFYRYRIEAFNRESVDLKRLFREFISAMIKAMNRRYMSTEDFEQLGLMIDVFFDNGAMRYTDITKFTNSVNKLQNTMNFHQKSVSANVMNNRLFLRMRDRAMRSMAEQMIEEHRKHAEDDYNTHRFVIESMIFGDEDSSDSRIVENFKQFGLMNAALYTFKEPVRHSNDKETVLPEYLNLRCVVKEGELYIMPPERMKSHIGRLCLREELSTKCQSYTVFPVLCNDLIYGFLVCELDENIARKGEMIAARIGVSLDISHRHGTR